MSARVWSRFSAKKADGSVVKLRIQDMPAGRLEDVVNLMTAYYNERDIIHKIVGVLNNPAAVAENLEVSREMLKLPSAIIIVCCEDNGDAVGEIIGASATGFTTLNDKLEDFKFSFKTKEMEKLFEMYLSLFTLYDVLKSNKVDRYMDDKGLAVSSKYEDVGIRKELLNVRRKICKDQGAPFVGDWVNTDDGQKAAEADRWETAFEVSRDEIGRKLGTTISEGPSFWKFMIGKPQ